MACRLAGANPWSEPMLEYVCVCVCVVVVVVVGGGGGGDFLWKVDVGGQMAWGGGEKSEFWAGV